LLLLPLDQITGKKLSETADLNDPSQGIQTTAERVAFHSLWSPSRMLGSAVFGGNVAKSYLQIESGQLIRNGEFTIMFWMRIDKDLDQYATLIVSNITFNST